MTTIQPGPRNSCPSDDESSYCIGSFNSSTETSSDIPGPGRLLGKAYGHLGKTIERYISAVAVKVGRGPRLTAMKMRRLNRGNGTLDSSNLKKLEKAGKRLASYVK